MNLKLNLCLGLALSFAMGSVLAHEMSEVDANLINAIIDNDLNCAENALEAGANPNVKVQFDTCQPICTSAEFSDPERLKAQYAYDENFAKEVEKVMPHSYYGDGRDVPVQCDDGETDKFPECYTLSYLQAIEDGHYFGWFVADNSDKCDYDYHKNVQFSWRGHILDLYFESSFPLKYIKYTYPLFLCTKSAAMTKLLLDYGAKVDQKDQCGTPLTSSIIAGEYDTMYILIRAGANIHMRINRGSSILDLALFNLLRPLEHKTFALNIYKKIVGELLQRGVLPFHFAPEKPIEALTYGVITGNSKLVSQFLTPCIDVNEKGIWDYSALMFAVWLDQKDIIKQLLEFPTTNVNVKNKRNGETALVIAAMRNDLPVVELLLQHGADTKPLLCRELEEQDDRKYSKEVMDLIARYNAYEVCTENFSKK